MEKYRRKNLEIYIFRPEIERKITQRDKVKLWGAVAEKCLTREIDTDEKFFQCLANESGKHFN